MSALTGHMDPAKVWGVAAANAIAAGAPAPAIATWLDHGLTPEPGLFMYAAHAGRADVLTLLFNAVRPMGQASIEAGALAALASPLTTDAAALDDMAVARLVLAHTTPALLNGPRDGGEFPLWWLIFRDTDDQNDVHHLDALLALLRDHGADLAAVNIEAPWGGRHGDVLRTVLRVERERAELDQAADEANQTTTAARGRQRL